MLLYQVVAVVGHSAPQTVLACRLAERWWLAAKRLLAAGTDKWQPNLGRFNVNVGKRQHKCIGFCMRVGKICAAITWFMDRKFEVFVCLFEISKLFVGRCG